MAQSRYPWRNEQNPQSQWTSDASSLVSQPVTGPSKQGKWNYQYKRSGDTGDWTIGRTWQSPFFDDINKKKDASKKFIYSAPANDPTGLQLEKGMSALYGHTARTITKPSGWNPAASQFPWTVRRGITSDPERMAAYSYGVGGQGNVPSAVRRSPAEYFQPNQFETEQTYDPRTRKYKYVPRQINAILGGY